MHRCKAARTGSTPGRPNGFRRRAACWRFHRALCRWRSCWPTCPSCLAARILAVKPTALAAARLVARDARTLDAADAVATDNVLPAPATVRRARRNRTGAAKIRSDGSGSRTKPSDRCRSLSHTGVASLGQMYSGTGCRCSGVRSQGRCSGFVHWFAERRVLLDFGEWHQLIVKRLIFHVRQMSSTRHAITCAVGCFGLAIAVVRTVGEDVSAPNDSCAARRRSDADCFGSLRGAQPRARLGWPAATAPPGCR